MTLSHYLRIVLSAVSPLLCFTVWVNNLSPSATEVMHVATLLTTARPVSNSDMNQQLKAMFVPLLSREGRPPGNKEEESLTHTV
jgi:hypothetical protein